MAPSAGKRSTEMVSGALARFGATVAVAVTGIAGPGGGTHDKPVGTVWIGWKRRGGYAQTQLFHFDGDREAVRRQTVAAALRGVAENSYKLTRESAHAAAGCGVG